ncbi:PAS domain-containing protein [candidate division KSB1 bacterium]|nr:PAS domain-containing protein [candidate division KSB1 bacterium]
MIGKLDAKLLEALVETLPLEFSIVDANDKVVAWNKHESRIFRRAKGVLGMDVRKCHPGHSLSKVEEILNGMKKGTLNKARFWIDLSGKQDAKKQKVLIEYYALRDENGTYLGCLEASQNITEIQSLTGEKRLLDSE